MAGAMKIDRVVWRGLKALESRDDLLKDDIAAPPADSVCLRGLNGSGKTTYLETIAKLWGNFRNWSQHGGYGGGRLSPQNLLTYARLAAIHVIELPGPAPSLWLVVGEEDLWESVPHRGSDPAAGVLKTNRKGGRYNLLEHDSALYRFWDINATKLEQVGVRGNATLLPNMVMIGAEDRLIAPLQGRANLFELAPEASFRFLTRYEPVATKAGHLENSMAALLAVAPDRFAEIAKDLNRVLPNIQLLNRADPQKRRPLVKLACGKEVTLEHLSAGERAALIALFTMSRWMTRGGVVLIDEPELHQHLSLIRSNLSVIEQFVVERMEGQLIVASHAPEVWDHFRVRRPILDLDLPSGAVAV